MREVGGLSFDNLPSIRQTPLTLRRYIPHIYRRYVKKVAINWPMVALDTYEVVKVQSGKIGMETVASCPATLRKLFGLSPGTSLMLRGVADDRQLEQG